MAKLCCYADQLEHNDIKTTSLYTTNIADTDSLRVLDKMDENRRNSDS